jgi:hypothetical protein
MVYTEEIAKQYQRLDVKKDVSDACHLILTKMIEMSRECLLFSDIPY